jgi:predicted dehydrogenase
MSTPPFKIGFIGTGGIAIHQMNLLRKLGNVEIAAAADVAQGSLDRARNEHGVHRLYTDYRRMLHECPDIEAVSICTPNGLHAENAIASLDAGKHVLVEKPMAMNAAQGQAMIDAAHRNHRHLVVGFQWRFDAKTQFIKDQIKAGQLGDILYVRVQALRRRGIPNWGVFGRKDLQGGGPMIDIGVHCLEMAHFMIGTPQPTSASGNTWTYHGNKPQTAKSMWPNWDYKSYTVEDLAVGQVRFANGIMLSIEASFVAHIPKDIWNVTIMGTNGGANWESSEIYTDVNDYLMNLTPGWLPTNDNFLEKMKHFVEVCKGQRQNESSGEHGLMIQKILDALYTSAAEGKEVTIA